MTQITLGLNISHTSNSVSSCSTNFSHIASVIVVELQKAQHNSIIGEGDNLVHSVK